MKQLVVLIASIPAWSAEPDAAVGGEFTLGTASSARAPSQVGLGSLAGGAALQHCAFAGIAPQCGLALKSVLGGAREERTMRLSMQRACINGGPRFRNSRCTVPSAISSIMSAVQRYQAP